MNAKDSHDGGHSLNAFEGVVVPEGGNQLWLSINETMNKKWAHFKAGWRIMSLWDKEMSFGQSNQ